jgi:hypothetical protein
MEVKLCYDSRFKKIFRFFAFCARLALKPAEGIKIAKFDANFACVGNICTKMKNIHSLTLLLIILLVGTFLQFFHLIRNQRTILRFLLPIRNGLKTILTVFYKCVLDVHFVSIQNPELL